MILNLAHCLHYIVYVGRAFTHRLHYNVGVDLPAGM